MPSVKPHLLHIRPTFTKGGAEVRSTQIMNGLAGEFRHTVISLDGRFDARTLVQAEVEADYLACPNTRNPLQMIGRLSDEIRKRKPDLVLTYNWGSLDGASAALWAGRVPVIHTEDGFGPDEITGQKWRRVWTRRVVLRHAYRVIAPSRTLERMMREVWKLPARVVRYLPNGVDLARFHPVERDGSELVVGSVASLSSVKRQTLLIEACAEVNRKLPLRLILAGEGPELARLRACAERVGFGGRVEFLGLQNEIWKVYQRMDIFALSSSTEQMPLSVLEAMATGLPVLSTDVGDVRNMVSEVNRGFVVDEAAYEGALAALAGDGRLRRQVGEQNRAHCAETYDLDRMIGAYRSLYGAAIGGG